MQSLHTRQVLLEMYVQLRGTKAHQCDPAEEMSMWALGPGLLIAGAAAAEGCVSVSTLPDTPQGH